MKKYFAGLLTGLLITGFVTSALAISGRMTIEVDPINVQVNGEVFAPTDVNGEAVPIFAYNGTTYAPLRALAEAYGLEVGYDKERNMATVGKTEAKTTAAPETTPTPDTTTKATDSDWSAEDEAAYQEFKGMWEISVLKDVPGLGISYTAVHDGNARTQFDVKTFENMANRMVKEMYRGSELCQVVFSDEVGNIGMTTATSYEAIGGSFKF